MGDFQPRDSYKKNSYKKETLYDVEEVQSFLNSFGTIKSYFIEDSIYYRVWLISKLRRFFNSHLNFNPRRFFWPTPIFLPTPFLLSHAKILWNHTTHAIFLTHSEILWTHATYDTHEPPLPPPPPNRPYARHPRYLGDSWQH